LQSSTVTILDNLNLACADARRIIDSNDLMVIGNVRTNLSLKSIYLKLTHF